MLQSIPLPDATFAQRLRAGAGRRTFAIGAALLVEALLLLLLLSLGADRRAGRKEGAVTLLDLDAENVSRDAARPSSPEPKPQAKARPAPQRPPAEKPLPAQSATPVPPQAPKPPIVLPVRPTITPPPSPQVSASPGPPAPARKPVYGPPDTGRPAAMRDTERVGTAPNGEPLYAAAWYREPRPEQMRGYLSTARAPSWGLIACRTVGEYRVEDCVGLHESPEGSQIVRAMLAAAWEFRVRPPRLGGRPLVGSWVRIRFDYGLERR